MKVIIRETVFPCLLLLSTFPSCFNTLPVLPDIDHVLISLNPRCIVLFTDQNESLSTIYIKNIAKSVSSHLVSISTVILPGDDAVLKELPCQDSSSLFVILHNTLSSLSQIARMWGDVRVKWLVFTNRTDYSELIGGIYIPLNVQIIFARREGSIYHLEDVYHLGEGQSLIINQYGTWSRVAFHYSNKTLNVLRNDLKGIQLRGTAKHNPPTTIVTRDAEGNIDVHGLFGVVWKILETTMNFTTKFYSARGNSWGTLEANGSWTGMVYMVFKREIDVAVSEFSMSQTRAEVVDTSVPIMFTKQFVFIRQPENSKLRWSELLRPFRISLWMALAATVVGLSLVLAGLHSLGRRLGNAEAIGPARYLLPDSLLYVIGIFCQQGHEMTPASISCRVVYWSAYMTSVVLMAAYSANLIASITTHEESLPFRTLQGLLEDGSYTLGVADKSGLQNDFANARNLLLKNLYQRLIAPNEKNLPASTAEGIKRICTKDSYAFMGIYDIALSLRDVPCSVVPLPDASFIENLGIIMPKQSTYRELINYNILKLRTAGILQRLRSKMMDFKFKESRKGFVSVQLRQIAPVIVIISVGALLSVLILMMERHFMAQKNKTGQSKSRAKEFGHQLLM